MASFMAYNSYMGCQKTRLAERRPPGPRVGSWKHRNQAEAAHLHLRRHIMGHTATAGFVFCSRRSFFLRDFSFFGYFTKNERKTALSPCKILTLGV